MAMDGNGWKWLLAAAYLKHVYDVYSCGHTLRTYFGKTFWKKSVGLEPKSHAAQNLAYPQKKLLEPKRKHI